ncbi:uncharacterized protein LOC116011994 [Ipomoea triloba]|uniref:uncharacterized protein LOC116011994 n=1 Tax=Ipomoea triloba TaxID=35885 RepID=UPI00125DDA80|nr:uncharacterized protein LOC116011994 [Ipomoea triloba]GMC58971.1 ATP-dependent RNA helicase DBP3-like [Ipomoea batatas]
MGKSNDSIDRRKNKKIRRKQDESSKVSNRIASIIAAKKRRLTGKRRKCQGMCFSLPTPEDPFNDKSGKSDPVKNKKRAGSKKEKRVDKKKLAPNKRPTDVIHANMNQECKIMQVDNLQTAHTIIEKAEGDSFENYADCPSKFLLLCLNTIQNAMLHDGASNDKGGKPFFAYSWGIEFWKRYSSGKDILDTSQAHSSIEQIAWIASTAADTIAKKEKEGLSLTNPFLLYLVPSQEKAVKVRQICKPLKTLGIHTISLHPGASMDHQIQGLKSCEPEFVIATPERLQELVSCNAINISGVSLLVVDGPSYEIGSIDAIKTIRQIICGSLQTVVFSDCSSNPYISVLQKLIQGSFCRIPLESLTHER